MKPQPFATKWRVVFSLFVSCGIFALPSHAATCSSSNLPTGPTAYIATSPNLVTVMDASTNAVACTITVGTHPTNLAVSPDGSQLFVENDADASVSVIDLATGAVTSTIDLSTAVSAPKPFTANLAVSPDGTAVYVVVLPQTVVSGTTKATLDIISLPSLTVSAASNFNTSVSLAAVTGPGLGIAFTPDGATAYISTGGLTYAVTGGASPSISSTISVSGDTVAVAPNGNFAYIVNDALGANAAVSKITIPGNTVSTFTPSAACDSVRTLAIAPDSKYAYYACSSAGAVQAIDTSSNAVAATVHAAALPGSTPSPVGMAISFDGTSAYLIDVSGRIRAVTIASSSVAPEVSGPGSMSAIAFRPVQLSVTPKTMRLGAGQSVTFTPTLKYSFGGSLTMSVSCAAGGAACGTIDAAGNYTAPPSIPSPNDVKVIAKSTEIPVNSLLYPSQSVVAPVAVDPVLVFTSAPLTGSTALAAGKCSASQLTIESQNGSGVAVPVTGTPLTVNLTSTSSGGVFSTSPTCSPTTATVTMLVGNADVSFYYQDTQAGNPSIRATATGYTPNTNDTQAETVNPGAASKLAFTTQPGGGTGGTAWAQQPIVTLEDAGGNTVTGTGAAQNVTLAIQNNAGPGGVLSGTATVAVNTSTGQAIFSGLSIDKTGTGYTLTATGNTVNTTAGVVLSSAFNITTGPAAKVAFTTSPGNSTGGVAFSTQPVVTLEDAGGNAVTGTAQNVTLAIQNNAGPGGVLSGTATVAVNTGTGLATFSGLSIDKMGTGYTLTATGNTVNTTAGVVLSSAFNITTGPAAQLAFTTQPSNGTANSALTPAVVVHVEDAGGNLVTTGAGSSASITITSAATPASPIAAPVGGSTTVTAAGGVATFGNLVLTQANIPPPSGSTTVTTYNYTMTAASATPALTSLPSNPFTILPATATKLVFTTQPANGTAGVALGPFIAVVEDTFNNVLTSGAGSNASVAVTSTAAPATPVAAPASGTTTVVATGGVATFSNLILSQVGTTPLATTKYSYTLTAASGGLTSAGSTPAITIVPGAATQLVFNTQPASGTIAGNALASVVVYVEDATGLNVVTSGVASNASVAISSTAAPSTPTAAPIGGTTTVAATGGVATFSNLVLTRANIPPPLGSTTPTPYTYTLTVSSGALTSASSTPAITIVPAPPSQLVFNNVTLAPLTVGVCSAATLMVQTRDQYANTSSATSNSTINLHTNSQASTVFSTSSTCSSPTTTLTVPTGQSFVTFYYSDTRQASPQITASANLNNGLTTSSPQQLTVSSALLPPVALPLSPPAPINVASVSVATGVVSGNTTFSLVGPISTDAAYTFSCSTSPPPSTAFALTGAACSFGATNTTALNTIIPTSSNTAITTVTMSLSVTRGTAFPNFKQRPQNPPGSRPILTLGLFLALTFLWLAILRRRVLLAPNIRGGLALVFLLIVLLGWVSSCTQFGVPANPPPPTSGTQTPSGSGTLYITATPSTTSGGFATLTTQVTYSIQ